MKRTFLRLLYRIYSLRWLITRPITLGVRVLLVKDEQVLLVKHSYQDGWFLPGGGVKRKETPEQAARRECFEESGAKVWEMELVGIFTHFVEHKNDHIVVFISNDFEIEPRHDFEIERVEFFQLDALPHDIKEGSKKQIEAYRKGEQQSTGYW